MLIKVTYKNKTTKMVDPANATAYKALLKDMGAGKVQNIQKEFARTEFTRR